MTTERYLSRLYWLINTIGSRDARIKTGRSRATNMVAPLDSDPVQTSPKDTLCEIMSDVVDTDVELNRYKAQFNFIMGQVNELSGLYSAAYVFRRYGRDQSINEIANEMNISRSTVYRVHHEALEEFEHLYGDIYKAAHNFQFLEHFGTL